MMLFFNIQIVLQYEDCMTILFFILLILLSGLFSGAEIAFFSLSQSQARHLLHERKKNAHILWRLKQKPQRLLITILIGNNIVNVLTASIATVLAVDLFGSRGVGIATGVVTLLILVFGEITPKSLAQKNNKSLSLRLAPLFYGLSVVLYPVSWVLIRFNNGIAAKVFKTTTHEGVTESQIRSLTRLGVEAGAIQYREHEIIENVLEFDEITVGEIETPRYQMVVLNGDVPIDQIAFFVGQQGFSRYPVYKDDEDNIIGYVHVNDLLKKLKSDERDELLKDNIRPIKRVKASLSIERVFRKMIKSHEHMMLVVREDGNHDVVGLITLEDVLEELVGEIRDETDKKKERIKI